MVVLSFMALLSVPDNYFRAAIFFPKIVLVHSYSCSGMHNMTAMKRGTPEVCEKYKNTENDEVFKNVPHINAAHCDKQNKCKMLAGRFEFYYDVLNGTILGPVTGEHINPNGIHKRVPISYTPDGKVLTNDRVINWAIAYVKEGRKFNLLNSQQFNWCKYAPENNWPYKASFNDQKSKGRYNVYFFNRQSCIYDTVTKQTQHFNTRFLHKSNLRIDLDYNPAIFPIHDPLNGDVRLVKHYRQHWYESSYEILVNPTPKLKYFIKINPNQELPSIINDTSGPLISRNAYRSKTDICLSNFYQNRVGKNGRLLTTGCGFDQTEIADTNPVYGKQLGESYRVMEIDLHTIPRHPKENQGFFGVNTSDDNNWQAFANDGVSFSASTSWQTEGQKASNKVNSLLVYSKYLAEPPDIYDEFYPMPYLSLKENTLVGDQWSRETKTDNPEKFLNYVDDIAYLHLCGTILVVFGPLYTEFPQDKFNLKDEAPVGAIIDLGLYETTNAFFADYAEPGMLYFYFRLNYIAKYSYTCATGQAKLVTAKIVDKYHRKVGTDDYKNLGKKPNNWDLENNYSEEEFFRELKILSGPVLAEPPDPRDYPLETESLRPIGSDLTWLYYFAAAVAILILIMIILCLFVVRKVRKRHAPRPGIGIFPTFRSGMTSLAADPPTRRSSMPLSTGPDPVSRRSGLTEIGGPMDRTFRSSNLVPASTGGPGPIDRTFRSSNLAPASTGGPGPMDRTFRSSNLAPPSVGGPGPMDKTFRSSNLAPPSTDVQPEAKAGLKLPTSSGPVSSGNVASSRSSSARRR